MAIAARVRAVVRRVRVSVRFEPAAFACHCVRPAIRLAVHDDECSGVERCRHGHRFRSGTGARANAARDATRRSVRRPADRCRRQAATCGARCRSAGAAAARCERCRDAERCEHEPASGRRNARRRRRARLDQARRCVHALQCQRRMRERPVHCRSKRRRVWQHARLLHHGVRPQRLDGWRRLDRHGGQRQSGGRSDRMRAAEQRFGHGLVSVPRPVPARRV